MVSFTGIPIRASSLMVGMKFGVRVGNGPIVVSPAVLSLIRSSRGEELARLLHHLRILQLPEPIEEALRELVSTLPIPLRPGEWPRSPT